MNIFIAFVIVLRKFFSQNDRFIASCITWLSSLKRLYEFKCRSVKCTALVLVVSSAQYKVDMSGILFTVNGQNSSITKLIYVDQFQMMFHLRSDLNLLFEPWDISSTKGRKILYLNIIIIYKFDSFYGLCKSSLRSKGFCLSLSTFRIKEVQQPLRRRQKLPNLPLFNKLNNMSARFTF